MGAHGVGKPNIVEQALAVVAYAEMRAIMLGWAQAGAWDPELRAWAAVHQAIEEGLNRDHVFPRASVVLRDDSRAVLDGVFRRAGPWPYDRKAGRGQIGSLEGLEKIFHDAGVRGATFRAEDSRLLSLAVQLADYVHRRSTRRGPMV